jgi:iron complex transport system ATP-binding protein
MDLLAVEGLGAAPWGDPLLADITFRLAPGSVLAVIGPNGAGKSSLLHTLAGGLPLSAGQVYLQDRPLAHWPRTERARALALLPQQSPLAFPFLVEEVILLGRSPHASGAAEDRSVLEAVMQATDTASLRKRLYTRLSGGERQRVQLARVLAQLWRAEDSPARLLLLDEPNTGLDLRHQQLIAATVRRLAGAGCAVVMVAHDCNFAASLAQRLLVLRDGRQQALGAPTEILTPELFREVFEVAVEISPHPATGVPMVLQA